MDMDKKLEEKARKIEVSNKDLANKERELEGLEFNLKVTKKEIDRLIDEKHIYIKSIKIIEENFGRREEKKEFIWESQPEYEELMLSRQKIIHQREIDKMDSQVILTKNQVRNLELQIEGLKTSIKMLKEEIKENK